MPSLFRKSSGAETTEASASAIQSKNVTEDNHGTVISSASVGEDGTAAAAASDSSQHVQKNGKGSVPVPIAASSSRLSLMGRKSKQLHDPETSSLGSVETGKEAKEKRSWMKTIGIRTLRKRKNLDLSSSVHNDSVLSVTESVGVEESAPTNESSAAPPVPTTSAPSESSVFAVPVVYEPVGKKSIKIKKEKGSSKANGSASQHNVQSGLKAKQGSTKSKSGKSSSTDYENVADKTDPSRFAGDGIMFKGKLIGVLEVSGPRGDRICQEALSELKMAVKAAGEHKQKITIHIALDGLRIRDEKTGDCLYHHQVHKISFIAQDLTDARAFGYIFGSPDMGHRFFGIKTDKSASQVVISMRDLFQVVFDMKKREIERAKQQLEMQQKFLATRATESTTQSKVESKTSIAETHIEGACALPLDATGNAGESQDVDLLNLEVELNNLQEGLDNIHTNLSETFRGSTASISSDPMNSTKMSASSMSGSHHNNSAFGADPFGDSFDPFDTSGAASGGFGQGINTVSIPGPSKGGNRGVSSIVKSPSPVVFSAADPFAQIDPFPTPKFSNFESGDSFFNGDPFDSPAATRDLSNGGHGNSSFSFNRSGLGSTSSGANVGLNGSSTTVASSSFNAGWQASFDDVRTEDQFDNFVTPDHGKQDNLRGASLDIFTDLDPLSSGRSRPLVDKKDFFQELKGEKDSFGMNSTFSPSTFSNSNSSFSSSMGYAGGSPATTRKNAHSSSTSTRTSGFRKVVAEESRYCTSLSAKDMADSTPKNQNSLEVTRFNSAFKSPVHASIMSSTAKAEEFSRNSSQYGSNRSKASSSRSASPPRYSPPPLPPVESGQDRYSVAGQFQQTDMFNNGSWQSSTPPVLPPPSTSNSTSSPVLSRTNAMKKSPQLLKQMTISSTGSGHGSPKTLPRSVRLGKQFTIDSVGSQDEPIPSLTPPPRPPHTGTLGSKTKNLASAVPRPYSTLSGLGMGNPNAMGGRYEMMGAPGSTHGGLGMGNSQTTSGRKEITGTSAALRSSSAMGSKRYDTSFSFNSQDDAPEPPPRPLQTTMINTLSSNHGMPLVSPPPPLPPKKTAGPTLSHAPMVIGSKPNLAEPRMESKSASNDLPLPLPSRKTQSTSHWNPPTERYCVPQTFDRTSVDPQVKLPKLSMEQALQQVASMSLGQLASKLECPVENLSSFTIQQLAEKLTLMEISRGNSPAIHKEDLKPKMGGSVANLHVEMTFDDDFSTMSAPTMLQDNKKAPSYDKYAVFRDLTVEDPSISVFSLQGDVFRTDQYCDDEDDRSRTIEKTLTGHDSSSERTLHVEEHSQVYNQSTMDDITDANLSDEQERFPLDDEEILPGGNGTDWATFETTFEDSFNTVPANEAKPRLDLFDLSSTSKRREESPWDSEGSDHVETKEETPVIETKSANKYLLEDDKLLEMQLPPDPEEFSFQPFEKPTPLAEVSSRESSGGVRRSSGQRGASFDPLEPERKQSPFVRQSSGSSKHSGKNSDYSDSGRRTGSRKNSRDYEEWDRPDRRDRRDFRPDSRNSSSTSRNANRRPSYRDSDDDFDSVVPSKYEKERTKAKGVSRSRLDDDDLDEEDDRSFASVKSNGRRSAGRSRNYKHMPERLHPGTGVRKLSRRRDDTEVSPERFSNNDSDYDGDSYEEERSRVEHRRSNSRDYYDRRETYGSGRRNRNDRPMSSGSSRYSDRDRDSRYERSRDYHDRHSSSHRYTSGERRRRDRYRDYSPAEAEPGSRENSDYSGEEEYVNGRPVNRKRGDRRTSDRKYYHSRDRPDRRDRDYRSSDRRRYRRGDDTGSVDSEPPSPDREDKRKLRFDSSKRTDSRDSSRSPRERDVSRRSAKLHHENKFEDKTKEPPPQSPFDDDFVQELASVPTDEQPASIEYKRGMEEFENADPTSSEIFFPAKFDIDVELESKAFNEAVAAALGDHSSASATSSSAEPLRSPLGRLQSITQPGNKRLESIRSEEEEKQESSDEEEKKTVGGNVSPPSVLPGDNISDNIPCETNMKKSESFNIFDQTTKDPFEDDEFFK